MNKMLHFIDITKASGTALTEEEQKKKKKKKEPDLTLPRSKRKLDVRTVVSNTEIAGDDKRKMRIKYTRKKDEKTVRRTVSPYEIRRDSDDFWAACKQHDNQIHRFKLSRISGAKVIDEQFKPKWEVKVGKEIEEDEE